MVEGIRLAEDGYDTSVKVLKDSFGRNDLLMADHVDAHLSIAPVKSSADVDILRQLHDGITFRIIVLEGVGVASDRYAVVVHPVLLKALPPDFSLLYRQRVKESAATGDGPDDAKQVQEILEFLRIHVEIRRRGA